MYIHVRTVHIETEYTAMDYILPGVPFFIIAPSAHQHGLISQHTQKCMPRHATHHVHMAAADGSSSHIYRLLLLQSQAGRLAGKLGLCDKLAVESVRHPLWQHDARHWL